MSRPRVEVVLSTYRARQDWLAAQLDSLWDQQGVDVTLLVRDDGSPDDTVERLAALVDRRPARILRGPNLGPGASFLTALREVDPAADYVAFCDQDDVWLPDKLRRAVDALSDLPRPALYSARVELVDEQLRHLGLHQLHGRGHSFSNALVQCAATGCTIVMDAGAARLLSSRIPARVVLHDAWAYLVVAGCGTTVYDPVPVVRYRQHGGNVVGVASTTWGRWAGRARRHWATGHERVHTVQDVELARLYREELQPHARRQLAEHLLAADGRWTTRLRYVLRGGPHRQDLASDLVYRVLFVLRRA